MSECNCDEKTPVKRTKSNGVVCYGYQCMTCGKYEEKKKSSFGYYPPTVLYDETIWRKYQDGIDSKWKEINNKRAEEYAKKNLEWWGRYNEYLESEKWKRKRAIILDRDKRICQGCLTNPATCVHHLTYDHVFNELAFELISLCFDCHEKAHGRSQ